MARARLLKPDFFRDEVLAELPVGDRLLFAGLWTLADREGRLEYRVKRIKADLFPFEEYDVEEALNRLSKHFITLYEVEGRKYIQINAFHKHQHPHCKEPKSVIPEQSGARTIPTQCAHGAKTPLTLNPLTLTGDGDGNRPVHFPPRLSPTDVARVLESYPLQQGIRGAHYATQQALLEIKERGIDDPVGFLVGVVKTYAASDMVKRGKTWSAKTFFAEAHYDDDPQGWADNKSPTSPKDNGEPEGGWNMSPLTQQERELYK